MLEILTASCGRYHDVLAREMAKGLAEAIAQDNLEPLQVGV